MKFVIWLVINALGVGAAVWLLDDITLPGDTTTSDRLLTLVIVGAIFGVITSVVRPIVNFLSLPLIILSLGLMLFVTNGLMLLLTSKVADTFNLNFHVEGFWTAVWGAIVISIASMIATAILPDGK
ncbi:phage holin family protein [Nocardioides marmoriginsengisoli]|uniref:Phage holin family protein n=1 Tax=Nocardioides marmoriginsengisoli TaxID=661483 RepID=A0A3N0CAL9_9ACTN|nr:phage holin family protein [Nocardioides marmoriginsengisoli]RNL60522.1 phage holin family protein [Nocardioides marmoriginsengisoli]